MKAIAAHAAIVLALVYAVLFAIDKVNGAMMFIENDIAKALILALAAVSAFNAVCIIKRERESEKKRSARKKAPKKVIKKA